MIEYTLKGFIVFLASVAWSGSGPLLAWDPLQVEPVPQYNQHAAYVSVP